MPSSPVDWITAIACCTALPRSNWTSSNLYCVRPLVSYFANGSLTQSLPICETSYTGFPSNNESNTRSACLSTSADETRRLRTSLRCSRCCIQWFLLRDTTCVLSPRKCTTSIFPGHDLFVRAHEVFLCPVQLSGTVCRSLLKRLRLITLGRSRKSWKQFCSPEFQTLCNLETFVCLWTIRAPLWRFCHNKR